jgi:hypothetical protein
MVKCPRPEHGSTYGKAAQRVSTKTITAVTHYHIQKKRRAQFIDEWRKYRRTVVRKEDVV